MPRSSHALPSRSARGLTLIELAVVLAIVAILASLAWPAYQDSVRKSRRSDAMAAVAQAMQAQERYRSNIDRYAANLATINVPTTSPKGYYRLEVETGSATGSGYRIRADAVSTMPQAQDSQCAAFVAEMRGGQILYSSFAAGSATSNRTPDPCWVQ